MDKYSISFPINPNTEPAPAKAQAPTRASKACQRCHNHKVKCDAATDGIPCSNCRDRSVTDCHLITSRRGIYNRQLAKRKRAAKSPTPAPAEEALPEPPKLPSPRPAAYTLTSTESDDDDGNDADEEIDRTRPAKRHRSRRMSRRYYNTSSSNSSGSRSRSATPSSGSLTTSTSPSEDEVGFRPRSLSASFHAKLSLPGMSWEELFDHFLENRKDMIETGLITYLGEFFPLASFLKNIKCNKSIILQHPTSHKRFFEPRIHNSSGSRSNRSSSNLPQLSVHVPKDMPAHSVEYLSKNGYFDIPSRDTLDELFRVYFHNIHPFYPIIDRIEFAEQYSRGKVPIILLNALCFVAATYCPVDLIHRENFKTRREARMTFYQRAKTLFEFDFEKNRLVLVRTFILLTFWGGSPDEFWTGTQWISLAVNAAETIGLHRIKLLDELSVNERRRWKIIWWCMVMRDVYMGTILGRSMRINLAQCSVEPLCIEDFDADEDPGESIFGTKQLHHSIYFMEMVKLSVILKGYVDSQFYPVSDQTVLGGHFAPGSRHGDHLNASAPSEKQNACSASYCSLLHDWRTQLPPQVDWLAVDETTDLSQNHASLCAISLRLIYEYVLGYFHLRRPCIRERSHSAILHEGPTTAINAASNVATLGSSVITNSVVAKLPQEVFPAFLLAMIVLLPQAKGTLDSRMADNGAMKLAQTQLRMCEVVLHQSQDYWDHAMWGVQLIKKVNLRLDEISPFSDTEQQARPAADRRQCEPPLVSESLGYAPSQLQPSMATIPNVGNFGSNEAETLMRPSTTSFFGIADISGFEDFLFDFSLAGESFLTSPSGLAV
ncbi:fungal-specific transcription factor domain-containing protein [Dipodascopsis tothii]|uniref:fungal-specific transcription factor domain-containing protein n=1 Tax=Dipodascopsis tothii TaxID=44089 RepID=UPI0034CF8ACC